MSRTEGITLPRLPASHARATSSRAIQQHAAASSTQQGQHRRAVTEPSYTAFVGTPRQDVPKHVYHDAAMFDDVFDKKGHLLLSRNTPKIQAPLNVLGYNSLYDPHCRKFFLNNKKIRSHLMHLGLITEDLKVVATATEQRQKIRAHEMLERKEQLLQKLEKSEENRIERLQRLNSVPAGYRRSMEKAEGRRQRAKEIQKMKLEKRLQAEKERVLQEKNELKKREKKLQMAIEEANLMEQARRNAACAQQQMAETVAYHKQYGRYGNKVTNWRRESDRIHNQMVAMERRQLEKRGGQQMKKQAALLDTSNSTLSRVESTSVPTPPRRLPSIGSTTAAGGSATPETTLPQLDSITGREEEGIEEEGQEPVPAGETSGVESGTEGEDREEKLDRVVEIMKEMHVGESEIHATSQEQKTRPEESEGVGEKDTADGMTTPPSTPQPIRAKMESPLSDSKGDLEPVREEVDVPETEVEIKVLDPEQGGAYFMEILLELFNKRDIMGTGYVSTNDFLQILTARNLGLQLNEAESSYLAEISDFYQNGHIHFIQVVPELPAILNILYNQRAQQEVQEYGAYPEEVWCELQVGGGTCYLHKLTGSMQLSQRPEDFRPFLRDDAFEDAIVDFFELADTNKDGVLSYDDFFQLLSSPMMAQRIYSDQVDSLLAHYLESCTNAQGWMTLEDFAPIAKTLLVLIYQNSYPAGDDWIELESRKYGIFHFNKATGEQFLPSYAGEKPPHQSLSSSQQETKKSKRKKSRRRRVSFSDSGIPSIEVTTPSRSGPPPLMRKQSREESTGDANNITSEEDKEDSNII